jgi:hypothetical protein
VVSLLKNKVYADVVIKILMALDKVGLLNNKRKSIIEKKAKHISFDFALIFEEAVKNDIIVMNQKPSVMTNGFTYIYQHAKKWFVCSNSSENSLEVIEEYVQKRLDAIVHNETVSAVGVYTVYLEDVMEILNTCGSYQYCIKKDRDSIKEIMETLFNNLFKDPQQYKKSAENIYRTIVLLKRENIYTLEHVKKWLNNKYYSSAFTIMHAISANYEFFNQIVFDDLLRLAKNKLAVDVIGHLFVTDTVVGSDPHSSWLKYKKVKKLCPFMLNGKNINKLIEFQKQNKLDEFCKIIKALYKFSNTEKTLDDIRVPNYKLEEVENKQKIIFTEGNYLQLTKFCDISTEMCKIFRILSFCEMLNQGTLNILFRKDKQQLKCISKQFQKFYKPAKELDRELKREIKSTIEKFKKLKNKVKKLKNKVKWLKEMPDIKNSSNKISELKKQIKELRREIKNKKILRNKERTNLCNQIKSIINLPIQKENTKKIKIEEKRPVIPTNKFLKPKPVPLPKKNQQKELINSCSSPMKMQNI